MAPAACVTLASLELGKFSAARAGKHGEVRGAGTALFDPYSIMYRIAVRLNRKTHSLSIIVSNGL